MDLKILLWLQDLRTPMWNTFFLTISNLVWLLAMGSLGLCLFKKTRKVGMYIFLGIFICWLINGLGLKSIVMRPRPFVACDVLQKVGPAPAGSSFPSSHTTIAFAFAWMFVWMKKKTWAVPAFAMACLIAFSRLYLGVHYPSDVLAGIVISCICSYMVYKGLQRISD